MQNGARCLASGHLLHLALVAQRSAERRDKSQGAREGERGRRKSKRAIIVPPLSDPRQTAPLLPLFSLKRKLLTSSRLLGDEQQEEQEQEQILPFHLFSFFFFFFFFSSAFSPNCLPPDRLSLLSPRCLAFVIQTTILREEEGKLIRNKQIGQRVDLMLRRSAIQLRSELLLGALSSIQLKIPPFAGWDFYFLFFLYLFLSIAESQKASERCMVDGLMLASRPSGVHSSIGGGSLSLSLSWESGRSLKHRQPTAKPRGQQSARERERDEHLLLGQENTNCEQMQIWMQICTQRERETPLEKVARFRTGQTSSSGRPIDWTLVCCFSLAR